MTTFTIDQLTAKVRELAAKRPDFVYEAPGTTCLYVHNDDRPGCIFGHAFAALDVDVDTLADLNRVGGIRMVLDELGVKHTDAESDWCARVQAAQDGAEPWAEAVTYADRRPDADERVNA